jgi:hypothetical protein
MFYRTLFTGKLLAATQLAEMKSTTQSSGTYGLGIDSSFPACGRAFFHVGDFLGWQNIAYSTASGKRQAVVMVNVNYPDFSRVVALAQKALCRG